LSDETTGRCSGRKAGDGVGAGGPGSAISSTSGWGASTARDVAEPAKPVAMTVILI